MLETTRPPSTPRWESAWGAPKQPEGAWESASVRDESELKEGRGDSVREVKTREKTFPQRQERPKEGHVSAHDTPYSHPAEFRFLTPPGSATSSPEFFSRSGANKKKTNLKD